MPAAMAVPVMATEGKTGAAISAAACTSWNVYAVVQTPLYFCIDCTSERQHVGSQSVLSQCQVSFGSANRTRLRAGHQPCEDNQDTD